MQVFLEDAVSVDEIEPPDPERAVRADRDDGAVFEERVYGRFADRDLQRFAWEIDPDRHRDRARS